MKRWAQFTAVLVIVIPGMAWPITRFFVLGAEAVRAVWVSATLAIVVQSVGFAMAKAMAPDNVFMGWGAGVALRLLALIGYAILGVTFGGLPAGPALISLVVFFFVTTLIEPVMLKQ